MSTYITTNVISGITHLCSLSIHNIYSTTEYIINGSHPDISNKIEHIDIINKIKIIEAFITECTSNNKFNNKESIKLSIDSIHTLILKINIELNQIKDECDYHKTKYFNYWRTPNCELNLSNVINYSEILDLRLNLLRDLINMINNK